VTFDARSRPSVAGARRAFSTSDFGSESTVDTTQRRHPSVRINLVIRRVSMPSIAITPLFFNHSGSVESERRELAIEDISLITNASAQALELSSSSLAVP
jgi:hypothetical protein